MTRIQIPNYLSYGNVTLKHPLMPLSDKFTDWINKCFTFIEKKPREIKAFDMVIKLLNKMVSRLPVGYVHMHILYNGL